MSNPLEIDLNSRTLEVLLKYTKDIFEATVGSWIEPWRASQKAEAMRILAQSEADQLRIVSKGQSDAIENLLETTSKNDRTVEVGTTIGNHSITAQGKKRFGNIQKILFGAARKLENVEINDHQPDPDWNAQYSQHAQDVSSEELQDWWSRILAGEIQNPGQTSLRALDTLKNMSPYDAITFNELSDYVISGSFLFSSDGFASNQFQPGTTINHAVIRHMQECGLVFGSSDQLPLNQGTTLNIYSYHSDHISVEQGAGAHHKLLIPVILLTTAGQELYKITDPKTQMPYLKNFALFLHYKNHNLFLLQDLQFHPNGSTSHSNKTHIMHG